ncbi:N-methyl-L-tryptophan oxidase [Polyangium fumosum]|uniref:N-methyl-L-tryptophan oxidase n=1 Tax=Polyangium fumosum TaxID=889272 RepID=A0A4U1IUV9_9BACT|nr:N-methyl-L-tryptophan oxidase [Polyangium fumosum]TKC98176.1 N-methyl-L-tryptophan oxidase [Polyangium fumosum]
MKRCDVVVIGLGIMGSAALWNLAEAGITVLGIEGGGPTHTGGSSHGGTRIFRRAYWEGEKYIGLLNRAHELWTALQDKTGRRLIIPTGGVFIGPRAAGVVAGSQRTAIADDIPHEMWDAARIRERLPAFQVTDDMQAIYEPAAYAIAAEEARLQMVNEAVRGAGTAWYGDPVESLGSTPHDVTVRTRSGQVVQAAAAVVTVGPWMGRRLVPELRPHLVPNRVPIYWFSPRPGRMEDFDHKRFPVFLYECQDGSLLYGIAAGTSAEQGVKIGFHNRQHVPADPDTAIPRVTDHQRQEIASYVAQIFPDLEPSPIDARLCYYTMSTDESFLIGASAQSPRVVYASACSGHGFKFATAIGEALAFLAQQKPPPVELSAFGAARFDAASRVT